MRSGALRGNRAPYCGSATSLRAQMGNRIFRYPRPRPPIGYWTELPLDTPVHHPTKAPTGGWPMTVHELSMIERALTSARVPDPAECREHFAAGRLPVYHGRRLVAYVDEPGDLPHARFLDRDGRLAGMLNVWEASAEQLTA